jgi:hypothetical protein
LRQLFSLPVAVTLGAGVAMTLTVLVGLQALLSTTGHHLGPGVFGFLLGCLLASAAWMVWELVISTDGSWSWRVGALAEGWTSEAVRHLGGRWRFRYNVVFVGGGVEKKRWTTDIDCVATGPHGVLAISTKWTSDDWDLNDPKDDFLIAVAKQASRNASRLRPQVRHCVSHAPVVPLVVCWGPLLARIDRVVSRVPVEGTEVLVAYGPQSKEWLATLDAERLDDAEISAIDGVVGDFIDRYEGLNAKTSAARSQARLAAARTAWAVRAGIAVTIVAMAWITAASMSRPVLRTFVSFARLGDGVAGALFLLLPTVLLTGSAAFALKANSWSARAKIKTDSNLVLIESMIGLGVWLLLFLVLWATG